MLKFVGSTLNMTRRGTSREKFVEAFDAPEFLRTSKSRSRSAKRHTSTHTSMQENTLMQETYNSEYKRKEIEHHHIPSHIRKNHLVHAEDFNVCPKYLATTTEFDEMTSMNTETKKFKESKRSDSSDKKLHLRNTFAEDRLGFIHNYNDLVVENKKLWREISKLRQQFGSIDGARDNETHFTMTRQDPEESGNKLSVMAENATSLDVPPEFKHLSPIAAGKVNYSTPPDHDKSKMKKTTNQSSLNFNLTSTTKKPAEDDACMHAVKAYNIQREVTKLENVVQNQFDEIQRLSQGNTPAKKVSFSNDRPPSTDHQPLYAKISSLEHTIDSLSRQLDDARHALQRRDETEKQLKYDIDGLVVQNTQLSDDRLKLMAQIDDLKAVVQANSYPKDQTRSPDQGPKFFEYKSELKKLRDQVQKLTTENEEYGRKLAQREDALKKSTEIARQHESTIIDLQSDVVKLADNAKDQERHIGICQFNIDTQPEARVMGTSELWTRIDELTREKGFLLKQIEDLKSISPAHIKKHPKSFYQIHRADTDLKQHQTDQKKKASAKSEVDAKHDDHDHHELSVFGDEQNKSGGIQRSLSERVRGIG